MRSEFICESSVTVADQSYVLLKPLEFLPLGGRLITKYVSLCNEALNGVRSSKGQQLVLVVLAASLLCRVAHEPSQAEDTLETTDAPHNVRAYRSQSDNRIYTEMILPLSASCQRAF